MIHCGKPKGKEEEGSQSEATESQDVCTSEQVFPEPVQLYISILSTI